MKNNVMQRMKGVITFSALGAVLDGVLGEEGQLPPPRVWHSTAQQRALLAAV